MSFHEFPTKGILKRVFPFTWRGFFFFFISLIILLFGIVRIELATMLWGSGFMLLALYTFVGSHIFRLIVKKHLEKVLDAVDCNLPTRGLFPAQAGSKHPDVDGGGGMAEIKVELPRVTIPGFQLRFLHRLNWHDRKPIELKMLLSPGLNKKIIDFIPEKRGFYKSYFASLLISDILGFTLMTVKVHLEEQVRVYPPVYSMDEWMGRMEVGGNEAARLKRKQRSEELLEVRKYFPGDDQRKINWKIYAHSGEMFIRIGEETPPPESRFLFILDSSRSGCIPKELSGDYLDDLVEACASMMNLLLLKGYQIMLTTFGGGAPGSFSLEMRKEMLSTLSEVWWTENQALELPGKKMMQAIIFSSPGSAGLSGIAGSLHSRGWGVSLFLKQLSCAQLKKRKSRLEAFLFLHEEKRPDHRSMEKKLSAFNNALFEEIARYRNPPWRFTNVHEI